MKVVQGTKDIWEGCCSEASFLPEVGNTLEIVGHPDGNSAMLTFKVGVRGIERRVKYITTDPALVALAAATTKLSLEKEVRKRSRRPFEGEDE